MNCNAFVSDLSRGWAKKRAPLISQGARRKKIDRLLLRSSPHQPDCYVLSQYVHFSLCDAVNELRDAGMFQSCFDATKHA